MERSVDPAALGAPGFRVGKVFADSLKILLRRAPLFLALAIVMGAIPAVAAIGFHLAGAWPGADAIAGPQEMSGLGVTGLIVVALLAIVAYSGFQGAVIEATVRHMRGAPAPPMELTGAGFRKALPLALVSALLVAGFIAMFVPFLLLGALAGPGAIALVAIFVILMIGAVPFFYISFIPAYGAVMVENAGAFAALRRSWDLVRGYRWPIAGWYLLYWLVSTIVSGVSMVLLLAVATGLDRVQIVTEILTLAVQFASIVWLAVGSGLIYIELRRVKDGFVPGQIAEIFD